MPQCPVLPRLHCPLPAPSAAPGTTPPLLRPRSQPVGRPLRRALLRPPPLGPSSDYPLKVQLDTNWSIKVISCCARADRLSISLHATSWVTIARSRPGASARRGSGGFLGTPYLAWVALEQPLRQRPYHHHGRKGDHEGCARPRSSRRRCRWRFRRCTWGTHCQVVHVEQPPLWLSCDVEPLTTAHCSGVPVPPPLSTVVDPAASSMSFARLLRPPDLK